MLREQLPAAVPPEAAVRRAERGVALVLVLWALALLLVVTASFVFESRTDTLVVRNSVSMARAEAAADAAVRRAVFEVLQPSTDPNAWKADGLERDWAFEDARLRVGVRDESAKIDINTAADALLKGLFASAGLADEEATRLVEAVLDWRDADSLRRANGAEEADYRAAGLAYRPANAPFQAIEELQLVLGMRPDLFRRLAPVITVFSRQTGLSTATASREALAAIPGIAPEAIDTFLARRAEALAAGQSAPAFPEAGAYASPANVQVLAIRAEAELEDGARFVREAVAIPLAAPKRPITYLAWREGTFPAEVPAAQTPGEAAPR